MAYAEASGAAPTGSKHGAAGWLGALVSKHACHGTAATGAALAAGALGKAVSTAAQSEGGATAGEAALAAGALAKAVSKAAQSEGAAAAGAGATVADAAAGAGAAA